MRNPILKFDEFMLSIVRWVLDFVTEWFSWTQNWIEIVLIVAIGAGTVVQYIHNHGGTMDAIIAVLFVTGYWWRHQISDTYRAMLLRVNANAYFTTILVFGFSVGSGLFLCFERLALYRVCDYFYWVTCSVVLYIVRLPRGGEPGKRRKHVKAKLKDLFSRPLTWLEPEPQGV